MCSNSATSSAVSSSSIPLIVDRRPARDRCGRAAAARPRAQRDVRADAIGPAYLFTVFAPPKGTKTWVRGRLASDLAAARGAGLSAVEVASSVLLRRRDRGDELAHVPGGVVDVDDLQADLVGQARVARLPGCRGVERRRRWG